MSDYPMLISNKLHSFRNFVRQICTFCRGIIVHICSEPIYIYSFLPFTFLPNLQCTISKRIDKMRDALSLYICLGENEKS